MTALPIDQSASDMRRGACPALSAPMMTGDGLLARVSLANTVMPAQMIDICSLAARHGNGVIDISARGNLQIRGLTEGTAPLLDADMRVLALPLREGLAVETPPLAGLDPAEVADPRPLADAIRHGARHFVGLAPKMSVVVDGHGQLRLSGLLADIRLVAVHTPQGSLWKILLGGTEQSGRVFDILPEPQAVEATLDLLAKLAALGENARGRDLAIGLPANDAVPVPASPFQCFPLAEGVHALGIGPAFGQAEASSLIALCAEAQRLGINALKPALDHSLIFFGTDDACRALAGSAAARGFVTSANDPRAHIAACPGSPACRSGAIATHETANRAAAEWGDLLDGSFKLHVTGCQKGCAHPQATALTLCGTSAGIAMLVGGKAAGQPFASVPFADSKIALRRLADTVRAEKREGENSAACLARLAPERLAAATLGRS